MEEMNVLREKIGDDGLVKIILYKLSCGEKVLLSVTGNSMKPFLFEGRDKVVLQKIKKPPKRGDIVFFRRKNGAYVLHRVAQKRGDVYYFSGDAQKRTEGPVGKKRLLAVCKEVIRDEKRISDKSPVWLLYKLRFFKNH